MDQALNRLNLLLGDKFKLSICVLLSCFLLLSVFFPKYSEVFAVLLMFFGFSAIRGLRAHTVDCCLTNYEKSLIGAFVIYGLVSIISFLYWPATRESHMRVEDDLKFLICIFLYLSLRRYEFNIRWLTNLFTLLALLMGFVSVALYLDLGVTKGLFSGPFSGSHRPSAGVNPMRYAAVALIVSCFAINYWFSEKSKGYVAKLLLVMALFMGLIGCVLTETRGVWLALPLLVLLYGYYTYKSGDKGYFIAILLGGCLVLGFGFQSDFVQKRVDRTVNNIELYQSGDGNSSLGVRLDMYKASLILIEERPIFGHGLGVFREKSKELKDSGALGDNVNSDVGRRKTPHNEFFQALVERGLIGLIATILLFAVPGFIFYRAVKSRSDDITFYGLCGLSMLVVFFVAGQTGTLFNHNLFTNFYIIMVLLFVSQIRVLEDKEEKAGLVES
jgi:O-antigen ligase